jgi:hypothetical protein
MFKISRFSYRFARNVRNLSDSVTYSGGQATSGQGGFYGSGGSRAVNKAMPAHHPEALARVTDIKELTQIMDSIDSMETELRSLGNVVNSRTIELKARIKKNISNPKVLELLNRLEIKGEPVWGLSSKERDLVRFARQRYNSRT